MADVFVLVHDNIALAGLHRKGGNLVGKTARLLRGFGLVLRSDCECVLHIARDVPLVGDVFRSLAHMVAVKSIPKPVTDHRIDILHVTHFVPCAQMCRMGGKCHVFLTTGGHNRCITKLDMLRTKCDGPQTRSANLVDAPGRAFNWQTCIDMGLTRRILALRRGQNLPENRLADLGFIDARTGDNRLKDSRAKIMGLGICKGAAEAAYGSSRSGGDYNIRHGGVVLSDINQKTNRSGAKPVPAPDLPLAPL